MKAALAASTLAIATVVAAQTSDAPSPETASPKFLALVYQRFSFEKSADVDQWEIAAARACQNLDVPNSWILTESITGEPEALTFDPFDSFEQMEKSVAQWGPIYAAHPELGRVQAQINAALVSQRTIIAVRRDDLSYRPTRIDLSRARFMRVLEVRLNPGHESDFAEAFQKLSAAYEETDSDLPWVVYQANLGTPSPAFFVLVPMKTVGDNDDLLKTHDSVLAAEGEAAQRIEQIAREAYASTESNLYAVRPDKSRVTKEFAAGDPAFWTPTPPPSATPKPEKKKPAASKSRKIKTQN